MHRRPILMMAALGLVVALGACGDDDGGSVFGGSTTAAGSTTTMEEAGSTTAAPTTTAAVTTTGGSGGNALGGLVADALAQGAGAATTVVGGGEEECLTSGLEAAIGAERFAELDALAAEAADMSAVFAAMSDPELDALVDVIGTCIDVEGLLTAELAAEELSPEAVACFAGTLSQEDTLKQMIRAMISGGDPTTNPEFIALMVGVMTEDCAEPLQAMLVEQFVAEGLSAESAACVAEGFMGGGLFAAVIDAMLSGTDLTADPELAGRMMTIFMECLTPEELEGMGG